MPASPDACFATPATTAGGAAAVVLSPKCIRSLRFRRALEINGQHCVPTAETVGLIALRVGEQVYSLDCELSASSEPFAQPWRLGWQRQRR